ncbi:hypothetical protein N7466_003383 [Penicillium verhagenii]|uniref:uncharacterized protein n=1 Tax=Penicillium verhagenii TaxID=1562060 RepID=UPI002544E75D|nr:uncharacterized protein N7466_003383 [Penicillium verhagenii]KAJ5936933.1 hypothetical protein N7466_003383 [Penicillium verhagenii]
MKSFSSSAINKSGKKFAPKAPVRRAAPVAPARRPSAVQQAQAQAAQASQAAEQTKEKLDATTAVSSTPPSSVPLAVSEQSTVVEEAPVAPVPRPKEPVRTAPKPATSIQIPRPKAKPPVSVPNSLPTPAPSPAVPTTTTPISTADEPTSPRTLPSEPTVVQSIEHDVEDAVANQVAFETAQPKEIRTAEPLSAPVPGPQPQTTAPISLKGAKKTSEITRIRVQPRPRGPIATPPSTQTGASAADRTSATPGNSVARSSVTLSTPEPSQASTTRKRKASKAGTSDVDGSEQPKKARRRKRQPTPEGAESVEILSNVIKMSELCKDVKSGKKSQREIALRKLDQEALEQKQKAKSGTPATPQAAKDEGSKEDSAPEKANGPVMRIVNGEIVLDAASLQVDRHADAARNAGDMDVVEENQLTRKVNQDTYGKRTKTESWDEDMTDLFYRGLRMFGTDFMVISKMFPGRNRRQIKLKFNNEERKNPDRIKDTLLGPRESIDIQTYSEMTNTTYDDPKVIQKELDEEKVKIEAQHEKEKALQEEMIRNPTTGGADAADDKDNAAPIKGKSRSNKKQIKSAGGGTEEVLGTIDD